ncbi:MAG: hypothetical protein QW756_05875 [Nitrososphaerota archaeon]
MAGFKLKPFAGGEMRGVPTFKAAEMLDKILAGEKTATVRPD